MGIGPIRIGRPSPAMLVALIALFVALGGTGYAALSGKDKKKVRGIADTEIARKSGGLSVAHAQTAASASTADSAKTAGSANTSTSANTANTAGSADQVDGADVCRTQGILNMAVGDPNVTICTIGAVSIVAQCNNNSGDTAAVLGVIGTAGHPSVFGATQFQTFDSPTGGLIGLADDSTFDSNPVISGGGFAAGSDTTSDQLSGAGTARALATSSGVGTCKFVLDGLS